MLQRGARVEGVCCVIANIGMLGLVCAKPHSKPEKE
jgi:hypothetical protein